MNKSILYLIGLPLGNITEISPRAVDTLNSVDLILAEDTRQFATIARKFKIKTKVISCNQYQQLQRQTLLLEALARGHVGYVSDAGMPGISDPGAILVQIARDHGYGVCVISGPCALVNAFAAAGFSAPQFYFAGFIDRAKYATELAKLAPLTVPLIFYEAPHRIRKFLSAALAAFGPRRVLIAREMTKPHEELISTTLDKIPEFNIKGEFTLVIAGNQAPLNPHQDLTSLVGGLKKAGLSRKTVCDLITAQFGIARQIVSKWYLSADATDSESVIVE